MIISSDVVFKILAAGKINSSINTLLLKGCLSDVFLGIDLYDLFNASLGVLVDGYGRKTYTVLEVVYF
jgi:hypothetical protein